MVVSLSRVASLINTPTPFPRHHHLHLPTTPSLAFRPWRTNKITDLLLPRQGKPSKHQVSFSYSSSSMESPPEGYRKNVGLCVTNPSNKIFSASRLDVPGAWQMPQGGIDEGEDPKSAALRELKEETGITSAQVVAEVPYWLTYDFPPHVREKLNKEWGSNWKGQAQKWFLLRFTGNEEEVNLLGDGTERAEFADWSWMTPQEVLERAVSFKKPVYEEVLKVFAPYLGSPSEM
eukprot:TRINITY_DN16648_c0_g1_i3.p1 TRINITY_DN16648_c0_g1~~TRINITY_DN16648_c0_g1_i3.p1  ORF type:complete len:260 (+),score=41.21 TRINITY_DN16648_c0_g1_i3:84-782(+)